MSRRVKPKHHLRRLVKMANRSRIHQARLAGSTCGSILKYSKLFAVACITLTYLGFVPVLILYKILAGLVSYQITPHWSSRTLVPSTWSSLFLFEEVDRSVYTYDVDWSRDRTVLPTVPFPSVAGGCWRSLWDPDPDCPTELFEFNGWMPSFAFRRVCLNQRLLVPLITISPQVFHYVPFGSALITDPRVKFYRPSRIPLGWYGMRPDAFDGSALKTTVMAMHIKDYTTSVTESRAQCPYAVQPKLIRHLDAAGIQRPIDGALAHPHPVHYAFENRMLQLAGAAIRGQPWFALFLKPEKQRRMRNASQLNPPTGYFNPVYDAKDITRYNQTPGGFSEDLRPYSESPVWFAHDVLHHMTPSSVGDWFDTNPTLKYLFATAVIPPELALGIPAQSPALYNFRIKGDLVTYIPENHQNGAYVQPLSCARWLSTNKIITPNGECLHMGKIDGIRAHNLFVISRQQLLPSPTTLLDLPNIAVIPQIIDPTASLSDRLTDPALVEQLANYATRVSATSMSDLYAKTAAYAAEQYQHVPASYIRPAALQALYGRFIDYHARLSNYEVFKARTAFLLGLPIASFKWLLQAKTSRLFSTYISGPHIWLIDNSTWVSQPTDAVLPGLKNELCNARDVPFFYVPPRPTLTARFASFNAKLHLWFLAKLICVIAWGAIKSLAPHFIPLTNRITYLLGLNWVDTPFGLILFLLSYALGLRVPRPGFYPVQREIHSWVKHWYARYFFLPSARIGVNAGLSLPYQIALSCTTLAKFFPRLNPLYLAYPSHSLHLFTICVAFTLQVLIAGLSFSLGKQRDTLPHHSHHPEVGPEPFTDVDSDANGCAAASVHTPPSDASSPGSIREWIFSVDPAAVPEIPTIFVTPSSELSSDTESLASAPINNLVNNQYADPLVPYSYKPINFPDPVTLARVIANLPPPLVRPDPDLMCVWSCLSPVLGIAPERLLAMWVSQIPLANRGYIMNGGVERDQLEPIFAYFGVGVTLRSAQLAAAGCPRAQGAQIPAFTHPQHQALSITPARTEWPSVTLFLGHLDDGNYHLTPHATPDANVNPDIPHPNEVVGYRSRAVPLVEIKEVLNVPVKIWCTAYHRLTGNLSNAASALHQRFTNVNPYRAPLTALPRNPVQAEVVQYRPDLLDAEYARHLATDMKNNPHTLNLRDMNAHSVAISFDALAKQAERQIATGTFARQSVELVIFHGAGGTGKTTALANYLGNNQPAEGYNSSNIRFHTWLNQLRGPLEKRMFAEPWVQAAGLVAHNFATGVMPLVQPFGGTLVLDDATQCWAGFIPLIVMTNPGLDRIVITMDALQGRTVFPEADSLSRQDPSTSEWLSKYSSYYSTDVYRYSSEIGDVFGIPTALPGPGRPVRHGRIYLTSRAPRDVPLLVVSPRFSETQNNGGTRCLTFRECQGQDINGDIAIDLGGLTSTATEHAVWTAITRAQGNVFLVMGASMSSNPTMVETTYGNSQILSAIMCVAAANQTAEITLAHDPDRLIARAVHNHMAACLSLTARRNLGLPVATPIVGKYVAAHIRSDWLTTEDNYAIGDFYTARTHRSANSTSRTSASSAFSRHKLAEYRHGYDLGNKLRLVAPFHNDLNLMPESTGYQMPPAPILTSRHDPAVNFERFMNEDTRELRGPGLETSFQHIPDGPHAMLHHNGQDRVTQKASEAKRIRRGKDEYRLTAVEKKKLTQLKKGFGKFFDVASWNDEHMHIPTFTTACQDYLAPWVSKRTNKAIDRSLSRDPGDIPYNFTRLFLKGQYIKKEDKRHIKAVPGQIVSEFPLGKQFRDAPFALYLERMAMRHAFPSTYLHARASPSDTSEWYKKHWTSGLMTANDYTAWDNGCDRTTVAFVEWLMTLSGMPPEYIDLYVYDRMNTFSFLGPHRPKQESGDRYTWIVNSLVNAAITGASLNCPKRTPCGYSGDDSIVLGEWRKSTHFEPTEWLMKPKPERGTRLTFCGMQFGGDDVYFDTKVILHRAQNGIALGRSDPDYWRSIKDSIHEAGSKAPDYDENLANAQHYLVAAQRLFDFIV